MTETWNVFAGSDIALGLLATLGFFAVVSTVFRASSKVDQRERLLKKAVLFKQQQLDNSDSM
jgi:hypothetical protein